MVPGHDHDVDPGPPRRRHRLRDTRSRRIPEPDQRPQSRGISIDLPGEGDDTLPSDVSASDPRRCHSASSLADDPLDRPTTASGAPRISVSTCPDRCAVVVAYGRSSVGGAEATRSAGSSDGSPPAARTASQSARVNELVRISRPCSQASSSARSASSSDGRVRGGRRIVPGSVGDGDHDEPVLRQRAGLVRDDQVDGAEDFLGVQPTNQDGAAQQPIGAQAEDDCEQDGRFLRDGGDRRRDARPAGCR